MRVRTYLPTRTFELVVHSLDIGAAATIDVAFSSRVLAHTTELAARVAVARDEGRTVLRAHRIRRRWSPAASRCTIRRATSSASTDGGESEASSIRQSGRISFVTMEPHGEPSTGTAQVSAGTGDRVSRKAARAKMPRTAPEMAQPASRAREPATGLHKRRRACPLPTRPTLRPRGMTVLPDVHRRPLSCSCRRRSHRQIRTSWVASKWAKGRAPSFADRSSSRARPTTALETTCEVSERTCRYVVSRYT